MWYDRSVSVDRDRACFHDLIQSPAKGSLTLPANIGLWVRNANGATYGAPAIAVSGRHLCTPTLGANELYWVGWFERGSEVTIEAGYEVLIDMGMSNYQKIGFA